MRSLIPGRVSWSREGRRARRRRRRGLWRPPGAALARKEDATRQVGLAPAGVLRRGGWGASGAAFQRVGARMLRALLCPVNLWERTFPTQARDSPLRAAWLRSEP